MPPKKSLKSPKKSSSSLSAFFTDNDDGFSVEITGRPPGLFENIQGDHVTAYSLIERGLKRVLSNMANETGVDIGLAMRNQLRIKRGQLFDYLTSITILNPTIEEYERCYTVIDSFIQEYNDRRNLKSTIRSQYQDALTELKGEEAKKLLADAIKGDRRRKLAENNVHIRDLFSDIARYLLTYYNKIPLTSFYTLGLGYENEGEGAAVKSAIKEIDRSLADPDDSKALRAIVESAIKLIYYPEIVNVAIENEKTKGETKIITAKDVMLSNAQVVTNFGRKKISAPRTNDRTTLCQLLARHLFILTAAYPEISEKFDKKLLIDSFIEGFVTQGKNGWPSIKTSEELSEIKAGVSHRLNELVKKKAKYQYKQRVVAKFNYKQGEDSIIYSSDEEDLPDITIKAPAASVTPLDHDQLTELKELRRLRDVITEGVRSGSIEVKDPDIVAAIKASSTGR